MSHEIEQMFEKSEDNVKKLHEKLIEVSMEVAKETIVLEALQRKYDMAMARNQLLLHKYLNTDVAAVTEAPTKKAPAEKAPTKKTPAEKAPTKKVTEKAEPEPKATEKAEPEPKVTEKAEVEAEVTEKAEPADAPDITTDSAKLTKADIKASLIAFMKDTDHAMTHPEKRKVVADAVIKVTNGASSVFADLTEEQAVAVWEILTPTVEGDF